MSKKKRFGVSQAISRGLTETIHVVENNTGTFRNAILPLSRIELDPDNPRKLAINLLDVRNGLDHQDPLLTVKQEELAKLQELAATIESSGVINPVVVYKGADFYRVVAGERRCLASILAGREEIEARVFNEKPDSFALKLIQWIENTAREDLTLFERIENIREIVRAWQKQESVTTPLSATVLKEITGLSLSQASYYLAVLDAPEDLASVIKNGGIGSLDKAAIIASVKTAEFRKTLLEACLQGCTLKALRQLVVKQKQTVHAASKVAKPATRRGRVASRVNMGTTSRTDVVKTLIGAVLDQGKYRKYASQFSSVDWLRYDEAARAFRQLVELLEQDMTG